MASGKLAEIGDLNNAVTTLTQDKQEIQKTVEQFLSKFEILNQEFIKQENEYEVTTHYSNLLCNPS